MRVRDDAPPSWSQSISDPPDGVYEPDAIVERRHMTEPVRFPGRPDVPLRASRRLVTQSPGRRKRPMASAALTCMDSMTWLYRSKVI